MSESSTHNLRTVADIKALLASGDTFADQDLRNVKQILGMPWVPIQSEVAAEVTKYEAGQ
ncbi:MAG TPA: hypothetical protein VJM46_01435 [Candidatus Saccharimonadales bacterium]|nr:hypothetical protein [Candidatus Saccharimonadales bacterium]